MAQQDSVDIFILLQNNDVNADEIKYLIHENINQAKDGSYLNNLVDFYMSTECPRCPEIFVGIGEPHSKYLFDKLHDCLKGSTRLKTLTLLNHIANKQPPWLHKISQHSLFTSLIKLLKGDSDVSHLMTATIIIVTLFPIIPSVIGSNFINDICEIFTRLAALNIKKSANRIIMMHLNVAIYALFLRLYALFPCNFLNYLRNYCVGNRDHLQVFNLAIRPMLDQVRMHPMLITCTKDSELNLNRWRSMETHDIVIECLKLSLDDNEGSREDLSRGDNLRNDIKNIRYAIEEGLFSGSSIGESIVSQAVPEMGNWSPSIKCGLFTPPPQMSPELEVIKPEPKPVAGYSRMSYGDIKFQECTEGLSSEGAISKSKDQGPPITSGKPDAKLAKSPELETGKTQKSKMYHVPLGKVGAGSLLSSLYTKFEDASENVSDNEVATILEKEVSQEPLSALSYRSVVASRSGRGSAQWCQSPFLEHIIDAQRGRSYSQGKRLPRRATIECSTRRGSFKTRSSSMPNITVNSPENDCFLHEDKASMEKRQPLPITQILHAALPQIYQTGQSDFLNQTASQQKSLFQQLSPSEILDRYLQLSSNVYTEKSSSLQTKSSGQSSKHGSNQEINLLKEEIQLLHTQLLYERNKREVHAERNRRLMGKAKQVRAVEEQNNAIKDQMRLMENDITNATNNVMRLSQEKHALRDAKDREIKSILEEKRTAFEEKSKLEKLVTELQSQVLAAKENIYRLTKEKEHYQSELLNCTKELDALQNQVSENLKLKSEIVKLTRELLLMSELNKKYNENLQDLQNNMSYEVHLSSLKKSYEKENHHLRLSLETKTNQYECAKSRVTELESQLLKKESVITELKNSFQSSKEVYDQQVKVVEEKYRLRGLINQKLEHEILKLYCEIEKCRTRDQDAWRTLCETGNLPIDKRRTSRPIDIEPSEIVLNQSSSEYELDKWMKKRNEEKLAKKEQNEQLSEFKPSWVVAPIAPQNLASIADDEPLIDNQ